MGRAYVSHRGGIELDSGPEVAAVNLPAGSYVISGKAVLSNDDGGHQHAVCTLEDGGRTVDLSQARLGQSFSSGSEQTIPLLAVVTFNAPARVAMRCGTFDGTANNIVLTATSVGGVN
jgi:hypothetical protein